MMNVYLHLLTCILASITLTEMSIPQSVSRELKIELTYLRIGSNDVELKWFTHLDYPKVDMVISELNRRETYIMKSVSSPYLLERLKPGTVYSIRILRNFITVNKKIKSYYDKTKSNIDILNKINSYVINEIDEDISNTNDFVDNNNVNRKYKKMNFEVYSGKVENDGINTDENNASTESTPYHNNDDRDNLNTTTTTTTNNNNNINNNDEIDNVNNNETRVTGDNASQKIIFSNTLNIRTFHDDSETMAILATPSSQFIQINQPLSLTCLTRSTLDCYWMREFTFLTNEKTLEIELTNQRSSGLYTCVCSDQSKSHVSYVLKVQGIPQAVKNKYETTFHHLIIPSNHNINYTDNKNINDKDNIKNQNNNDIITNNKNKKYDNNYQPEKVHLHHVVHLSAKFTGYPSKVIWFKDGHPIVFENDVVDGERKMNLLMFQEILVNKKHKKTYHKNSKNTHLKINLSRLQKNKKQQISPKNKYSDKKKRRKSKSSSKDFFKYYLKHQNKYKKTKIHLRSPHKMYPVSQNHFQTIPKPTDKYFLSKYSSDSNGVLEFTLSIESMSLQDIGVYGCEAHNHYGSDIQTIYLSADANFSSPTDPFQREVHTSECYKRNKISIDCERFVTYDLREMSDGTIDNKCYREVFKILECKKDSSNHSSCCSSNSVPTNCQSLCWGGVISKETEQECIKYLGNILKCHNYGKSYVPDPPCNITHQTFSSGFVLLQWLPPTSNKEYVTEYMITERKKDHGITKVWVVSGNTLSHMVEDIEEGMKYSFAVQSCNSHGSSYQISLPYREYYKESTIKMKPQINATLIGNHKVIVTWKKTNISHLDYIYLSYTCKPNNRTNWEPWNFIHINQSVNEYTLTSLKHDYVYIIRAAYKSISNHLGPMSDPIKFYVIQQDTDVIVTILIIVSAVIIITLILLLTWCCLKRKKSYFPIKQLYRT